MYSIKRILKSIAWLLSRDPFKRRRVRQECARLSASLFGDFPISDDYKLWREDKAFINTYKRLSAGNPYTQDRKFVLREFTKFTNNIPGNIAECGCFEGATSYFMASESPDTPLFIFDSFEGLSEPDVNDRSNLGSNLYWKQGDLSSTEEKLKETLKEFKNISIYKGWIPERFSEVKNKYFRLVHIDVDLYQPTLDSLTFFYPRMSKGGVIIMDDYGSTTCPGAHKAAEEFMKNREEHIIHLPTAQGVIIKS
jgi:hypothetical protein